MSENRKARFKGKPSLMQSADQKRQAWDQRTKQCRGRAIDSKRTLVSDIQGLNDTTEAQKILELLCMDNSMTNPLSSTHLDALFQFINNPDANVRSILDRGLITVLERALNSTVEDIQVPAAKCLTGLASGDHDQTSQLYALIPGILQILQSPTASVDLKTQLCWALGNIAVDCNACKGTLISMQCPQIIIALLLQASPSSQSNMISNLLWTLTNMVRGNADVSYLELLSNEQMNQLLSLLLVEDEVIAPMARWLFTFLTSKDEVLFHRLIAQGLFEIVYKRIETDFPETCPFLGASNDSASLSLYWQHQKENDEAYVALIRSLGNLCAGSEVCAHRSLGLCHPLIRCVDTDCYSKYTAREALRTLSYILNGAVESTQAAAVGDKAQDLAASLHALIVSEDYESQEAALLAIESIHPSLFINYYRSRLEALRSLLFVVVKLCLSHLSTALVQIGALLLLKTWGAYSFVADVLVQMDVAESLENLHYTSEEVAVTALAQEVTDILYRHMEEQEQEASQQLPVANHNVFAFAADARVNGAGRGAQAIQPAWMTSQSFQF